MTRNNGNSNTRTNINLCTAPRAANAPATPPLVPHPPLSAETVAKMLGVHRSDVMELVHGGAPGEAHRQRGIHHAREPDAFIAESDTACAFSRFDTGNVVVWLDEHGDHGVGRFVAENPNGSVRVVRDGFWGEYETAFPATQVQPFTCRVAPNRAQ